MNETIVQRWNDLVEPDDTVYVLGDVALGPVEEWDNVLSRLMGHKHLIVGNHDKVFAGNKPNYRAKNATLYNQWFESVKQQDAMLLSNGMEVNLSHFPYNGDHSDEDRYDEFRLTDTGRVLIHGHVHGQSRATYSNNGTLQIHVGVDAWNLRPVSEDEVIRLINTTLN